MKEGDCIKRLVALVIILMIFALFISCGQGTGTVDAFTAVNENGRSIRLGDSRRTAARLLGPNEHVVLEFVEDGIERVTYRQTPEVSVDFKDGVVCAIRLEEPAWGLADGLRVGSPESEVRKKFTEELALQYDGYTGLWMSLDEQGRQIIYDRNSEYQLRFDFEDDSVKLIMLQNNLSPEKVI